MLKALIDKLIQCRHKTIYLQHLVCILPKCSSSNMSRDALLLRFCIVLHTLETTCVMCVSVTFLLLLSCSLPVRLCDSLPSAVLILPLCSLTFSLLLFFLALGWWQSGIWVMCLLFHDMLCCVTAAAWSLSLLPPPPSSPRKPTEFNVRVCLRRPN